MAYPTTKIRVNATCRKCPHKVHRMEMKTAISCTILRQDRKSGSAGMPRPISYAVFCLKKKKSTTHIVTLEHRKHGARNSTSHTSSLCACTQPVCLHESLLLISFFFFF